MVYLSGLGIIMLSIFLLARYRGKKALTSQRKKSLLIGETPSLKNTVRLTLLKNISGTINIKRRHIKSSQTEHLPI